jgi:hypothetical protein
MRIQVVTDIACSIERTFDLLSDARNEPRWNTRVSRAELVTREPIGRGSGFTVVNTGSKFDAVVETYQPPSLLRVEVRGVPMDITAMFTLETDERGTALTADMDMRPKGIARFLLPLLGPLIQRDLQSQFARFKALCEDERATASSNAPTAIAQAPAAAAST